MHFDVRAHGATGTGDTIDSPAFNAAIQAAAAAGGGVVDVPAGTYRCFSMRLLSHVELALAPGSEIIAADSPRRGESDGEQGGRYDLAEDQDQAWEAYQDYGHNHWRNSLIWAQDAHDLAVTGAGRILGTGLSNGFVAGPGSQFDTAQPGVANKAISMKNCRGVRLRDFSIVQGGWFAVLLTGVDNVTIDNLLIDTNRDGIDIDCCRQVHVTDCTINSPWDDAICLKASYALGRPVPTANVTITGCVVSGHYRMGTVADATFETYEGGPGHYFGGPTTDGNPRFNGRIKLGTESNGGFRAITIANCVFEGGDGLALESVDGGDLEDIAVSNLVMRDLVSGPLFIILGDRLRGPEGTAVGSVRRISISNVVASDCARDHTSIVTGIPGHPVTDVRISHLHVQQRGGPGVAADDVTPPEFGSEAAGDYPDPAIFGALPAQGLYLRHVRGIDVDHLTVEAIEPDGRPVVVADDVADATWTASPTP